MLQPKRKATMTPVPKKLPGENPANPINLSRAEGNALGGDPRRTKRKAAKKKVGRKK